MLLDVGMGNLVVLGGEIAIFLFVYIGIIWVVKSVIVIKEELDMKKKINTDKNESDSIMKDELNGNEGKVDKNEIRSDYGNKYKG